MNEELDGTRFPDPLPEAVARQIGQRAGGRVGRLRVERAGDRVVIHGHAPTYHIKQLAIQGAPDVLGTHSPLIVEVHIQVGTSAAD